MQRPFLTYSSLMLLSFLPSTAMTLQLGLDTEVRSEYTDNANLVEENPESQLINDAILNIRLTEKSTTLTGNLTANINYRNYADELFKDEVNANINGQLDWRLWSPYLLWRFSERRRRLLVDPRGTDTPDNQQDVNTFQTGPQLRLPFSRRDFLVFNATYTISSADNARTDGDRYEATAGWEHLLSPRSNLNISFNYSELETQGEKIKNQNIGVNYQTSTGRSQFSTNVGFANTQQGERVESNGLQWALRWGYQIDRVSSLNISAENELSDTLAQIALNEELGDFLFTDIVEVLSVNIGYQRRFKNGGSLSLQALFRQQDYELGDRDQESHSYNVRYNKSLSRKIRFDATVGYRQTKFIGDDLRTDDFIQGALRLSYLIGHGLNLNLGYEHNMRESSVPGSDYSENSLFLSLSYQIL